jgi:hypothetical protein
MIIEVTQEDIDAGAPTNECKCPVALAILRNFEAAGMKLERIMVGNYSVTLMGEERDIRHRCFSYVDLPEEARLFVRNFDYKGKIHAKPFAFELDESEYVSLINEDIV